MEYKVTIIVPVYNVREYLEKCVHSITSQTYKNLEIILIDDGSTDGTAELCDFLSNGDSRIQVIHKENGGVTSARKAGIEKATGVYTLCVDGDDWIEPNMVEELLATALESNADIITSGVYRECEGVTVVKTDLLEPDLYTGEKKEKLYSCMMHGGSLGGEGISPYLWNKLVETSLFENVLMKLANDIVLGEDIAIIYACCAMADSIVVTNKVYYHYEMRNNSATHSINVNYLKNLNVMYVFLREIFEKNEYRDVLLKQLSLRVVENAMKGIDFFMGLHKDVCIPYYDFSKDILSKGAKVLLYGAGRVGQDFYKQIQVDKLYELVGWVDKNYFRYQEQGLDVHPINSINNLEFDYIILAFKYEEMAKKIANTLNSEYGVDFEKMLWLEPISIVGKYCNV